MNTLLKPRIFPRAACFFTPKAARCGHGHPLPHRLPASVLGTDTDVQVNCTGRVVRSLDEKGNKAVAAVIDEYCFERILCNSLATSC